jgi:Meckel syndrome type 1 protein
MNDDDDDRFDQLQETRANGPLYQEQEPLREDPRLEDTQQDRARGRGPVGTAAPPVPPFGHTSGVQPENNKSTIKKSPEWLEPAPRSSRVGKVILGLVLVVLLIAGLAGWQWVSHQFGNKPKRLAGMGLDIGLGIGQEHGSVKAQVQEAGKKPRALKPPVTVAQTPPASAVIAAPAAAAQVSAASAAILAPAPENPAAASAPAAALAQPGAVNGDPARAQGALAERTAATQSASFAPAAPAAVSGETVPGELPGAYTPLQPYRPALTAAADTLDQQQAQQKVRIDELQELQQRVQKLEDAIVTMSTRILKAEDAQHFAAATPASALAAPAPAPAAAQRIRRRPKAAARAAEPAAASPALGAQLLAVDLWGGTPSVVVTTGLPGDTRTRTLRPGDTLNGVTLQSADPATGQATFMGHGQTFTLSLGQGG